MTLDRDELLSYLKALADESRLRILGLLAISERSVDELATLLNLRAPTISHHLARLRELDLVDMRIEGNSHVYRLNSGGLGQLAASLATPEHLASITVDADDAWERKVLGDFFEGERLKEIPAQRKKRDVILGWLARQFEMDRLYTEAELNETLARHHPDTATLRRELIGAHLFRREKGMYWRVGGSPEDALLRLARDLIWGKLYTEAELDELIASRHLEPATTRTALVQRDLLHTENGLYWLPRQLEPETEV